MDTPSTHSHIDFKDALLRCREVAETEYRVADDALARAETIAERLCDKVETITTELGHGEGMPEVIRMLAEHLNHQVNHLIIGKRRKLNAKRPRLRKFTIALFGRTMAGKSTFREAITGDNGASIGKGGQNTTKRVHEYEWRGIHIIDTPGIGSYKGERYRQQAISAVGKSDLVLFMMTDDGIQQDVFEGMKDVLLENKPVFFILNVKRDLTKDTHRERFLKNPSSLLGRERIDGHFRRIQKLAVDTLGSKEPQVFVLHAQAAYLSTQKHPQADALYEASRMENLHASICEEVAVNGPIRRLQTLLDGTIGAIDELGNFYSRQSIRIKDDKFFFRRRLKDFELRASQFIKDQNQQITAHVAGCFQDLHNQVFNFIEDNIERKDIAKQWERQVKAAQLEKNLKGIQKRVVMEAKAFVAEFARELAVDLEFAGNMGVEGAPQHANVWDLKRDFKRTAAAAAVLSAAAGVAFKAGLGNIWNPVGWALMGASVLASIAAWICGKKDDQLEKETEKARNQLHALIDTHESKVLDALLKWLREKVEAKALKGISDDLKLAVQSLDSLNSAVQAAVRSTRMQVDRLNARLLLRIAEVSHISTDSLKLKSLARSRGLVFRALCTSEEKTTTLSKVASASLGENVILVHDGPAEEIIRGSLRPVRLKQLDGNGRGFVAHLTKRQMRSLGRMADALFAATQRIAKVPVKFKIKS